MKVVLVNVRLKYARISEWYILGGTETVMFLPGLLIFLDDVVVMGV